MPAIKKAPTKKLPTTRAELIEAFKDYEGFQAFERALESPEGPGSLPILLKGDPANACINSGHMEKVALGDTKCRTCGKPTRYWYVRHVNTKQAGRVAKMKHKAMVPVRFDELRNPDEISDLVRDSPDGLVHTGTNGARLLYKIPLQLRNERLREERDALARRRRNPKRVREDLANDASGVLGAEAADTIHDGLEYTQKTFRTTIDGLAEQNADD